MAEDLGPILLGGALAAAAIGIGAAIIVAGQPPPPPPGNVATGLSITVLPNPALVGQPAAVTGKLVRSDTQAGLPGMTIIIESSTDQLVYVQVTTALTAADGSYGAQVVFNASGTYYLRARFAGA